MIELARIAAFIAVLGTAIVYGTDAFCAMVLRPALAHVDDRCLVAVMGYVHLYGDRRMPVPGALGIVGAAASAALAAVAGQWFAAVAAGAAVGVLLVWLVLYVRVSAPINRQLSTAAKKVKFYRMRVRCRVIGTESSPPEPSYRALQPPPCASH